jgi:hypothetical protein
MASTSSPNATSAPWQMSMSASVLPARAAPAAIGSRYDAAASGTKLVPTHPSASSPVSSSILGDKVAR